MKFIQTHSIEQQNKCCAPVDCRRTDVCICVSKQLFVGFVHIHFYLIDYNNRQIINISFYEHAFHKYFVNFLSKIFQLFFSPFHSLSSGLKFIYASMCQYLSVLSWIFNSNQLCINTAIVYMHRFYAFHSFTQFHQNGIAMASLFLAAKVIRTIV